MRSLLLVAAGVVAGFSATLFTPTFNKEDVSVPITMHRPTSDITSPFAPVKPTEDSATPETTVVKGTTRIQSLADTQVQTSSTSQPETPIADVKHFRQVIAYLQYIDGTDGQALPQLLQALSKSPDNRYNNSPFKKILYAAIYQRWAEVDIDAALTHVADSTDRRESYRRDAIEGITLLASLEPDYVQQWIEDFAPDAPELLEAAYTGVASNDPEIESLLNDPTANEDSRMMLSQLYISEMTKADPESALRWALTQDNPMLQENAAMNVIFSWDPADTSGLQGFIDQLPPEQRDRVLPVAAPIIARGMATDDPQAAVAWAEQLPEDQRYNAMAGVIHEWAREDSDAAFEWLGNLPDTPNNHGLMLSAASSFIHRDASTATQFFAKLPDNLQEVIVEQLVFTVAEQQGNDTARAVQQIGAITLDSMDPDVDANSLLDRIASLQTINRATLLHTAINQRSRSENETVLHWVSNTPFLSEDERSEMKLMVQSYGTYLSLPGLDGVADYYHRQ